MRDRYYTVLMVLTVIVFAAVSAGCIYTTKATGGGNFIDEKSGDMCTFGFNAQVKDAPGAVQNDKTITGQFQFVDHDTGIAFHMKVTGNFAAIHPADTNQAYFSGYDQNGNEVEVYVVDNGVPGDLGPGDYIHVDNEEYGTWSGYLEGGNINAHMGN